MAINQAPMKFSLLFLLLFGVACSSLKRNTAAPGIALVNVTVVDVLNGSLIPGQAVIIEEGRITDVKPAAQFSTTRGIRRIDAKDKYLIPGLWDMHVHLELATKESLPYFLAYGVTGVRDMGTNSFDLVNTWRNEIEQGVQPGPRIVTPGPIIDGPFVVNGLRITELRVTVNTAQEARAAVDSLVRLGVDFIKVHQQISKDAYEALASQARKHSIPFVGHHPGSVTTKEVLTAGQKSIEHIVGIPEPDSGTYKLIREQGTSVTPNLLLIEKIARYKDPALQNDPRLKQLPASLIAHWKKQTEAWGADVDRIVVMMQDLKPIMLQRTAALRNAGIQLLAGTDLAIPYVFPGSSLHEELELLVSAGLSPVQALQAATINPARFFNKEGSMGSVQKGKDADLVLLNSNPLENISNAKDIHMVILKGRIFDRQMLDKMVK